MNVLVLLDDCDESVAGRGATNGRAGGVPPLAYVHSVPRDGEPRPFGGEGDAEGGREVVTLCGDADADRLAVALAAVVEGRRASAPAAAGAVRHLGVWDGAGASGDVAWRDATSGQMVSFDVDIAAATLEVTAARLLASCGTAIRQTAAKLAMPDWPEGMRRAISLRLAAPSDLVPAPLALAGVGGDGLLASLREADGYDDGE